MTRHDRSLHYRAASADLAMIHVMTEARRCLGRLGPRQASTMADIVKRARGMLVRAGAVDGDIVLRYVDEALALLEAISVRACRSRRQLAAIELALERACGDVKEAMGERGGRA